MSPLPSNEPELSEAKVIIHWPGKDTPACTRHAERLAALAGMLGFHVAMTPCDPGVPCINCINEVAHAAQTSGLHG